MNSVMNGIIRIAYNRRWVLAATLPLALLLSFLHAEATTCTKVVAPGVVMTEEIESTPPEIIHVLTVDLTQPGLHLEVIPGQDTITGPTGDIHQGREEVRETALRHQAVAAVNGDFFPLTGDPYGVAGWNGDLYSEPYPGRCAMGVSADGHSVIFDIIGFLGEVQNEQNELIAITGVDRMVSATDTNDLVVFTPTFGPRSGIRTGCVEAVLTSVNLKLNPSKLMTGTVEAINVNSTVGASIPADGAVLSALPGGQASDYLLNKLHVGDRVEFVCAVAPSASLIDAVKLALLPLDATGHLIGADTLFDPAALSWGSVSEAIGGGPRLVVDGKVAIDGEEEGFNESFINDPNPRTAVGVTSDGKLLLVTVDGRQVLSKGVSLADLASIMVGLGAYNAMNLDGGGSTTMAVDGEVVNSIAANGYERPVANALCVFSGPTLAPAPPLQVVPEAPAPPTSVPVPPTPELSISGLSGPLPVGQSTKLSLIYGKRVLRGDDPSIIWGGSAASGAAFVSQTGLITALRAGQGMVSAFWKGQIVQEPVTITGGTTAVPLAIISGNLTVTDLRHPRRTVLVVGVFTPDGAPEAGTAVDLVVNQGKAAQQELTTNIDGYAQTKIDWTGKGGSVTLSASGLAAKIINQAQP